MMELKKIIKWDLHFSKPIVKVFLFFSFFLFFSLFSLFSFFLSFREINKDILHEVQKQNWFPWRVLHVQRFWLWSVSSSVPSYVFGVMRFFSRLRGTIIFSNFNKFTSIITIQNEVAMVTRLIWMFRVIVIFEIAIWIYIRFR